MRPAKTTVKVNVTPPDSTVDTAVELIKNVCDTIAREKNLNVDELIVEAQDVYSALKIQKNFNGIGNNTLVQIK